MRVQDIETQHVHQVLVKIWHEKTETASRLRGRMENILGYATTAGYREGDNPAQWRGHLEHLLPSRNKIQKVRHHRSLTETRKQLDSSWNVALALKVQE